MRNEAEKAAYELFHIPYPPTRQELERAYRREAKKLHPDTGGDDEAFTKMHDWYEKLKAHVARPTNITVDGYDVDDLGKGLGPATNGAYCDACEGHGWREDYAPIGPPETITCVQCWFSENRFCYSCDGTGKYKQRSGRVVNCYTCQGTGLYNAVRKEEGPDIYCTRCRGTGEYEQNSMALGKFRCFPCNGTGEIQIHNPVLPKGALV